MYGSYNILLIKYAWFVGWVVMQTSINIKPHFYPIAKLNCSLQATSVASSAITEYQDGAQLLIFTNTSLRIFKTYKFINDFMWAIFTFFFIALLSPIFFWVTSEGKTLPK